MLVECRNDSRILPYHGDEGLVQLTEVEGDMIVNSLMGISGLAPTYHGIRLGKDIALANKETLVPEALW